MPALFLICFCENTDKKNTSIKNSIIEDIERIEAQNDFGKEDMNTAETSNINDIPVSTVALADFPFFSFPKNVKSVNKPTEREFDILSPTG